MKIKQEPLIETILEAEEFIINDEILKQYKLAIDESKIDVFDKINFITTFKE